MSSLKRADNLLIVNAVKAMNNADMQMYGIINKTNEYKTTVKNAAQFLRKKSVEDALKNIPVEELNHDKDGIRISLLKNAGYSNMSQLAGIPPQCLAAINGIGADNAAKIVERTAQICSNAKQLVKLKIQPTDKNQYANAIVTSLAVLINTKSTSDRAQTLYSTWHSGIVQHISNAKNMQSGIKWLFSSKDKKQSMLKSLMYLESLSQQGLANEISTLNNSFITEVQKWNTQSAWNAFQQNSAPFFCVA